MYKTIYVKTTGTCNLDCHHCFTGGKNGDRTQFDPVKTGDWIDDFIKVSDPKALFHIELHGGEPFLVPLHKLITLADRYVDLSYVSMCANSNLTFKITDDLIAFIKKYLGGHVGTSWDHWIRWSSEKQFDLWKSNLVKLREAGITIGLKVSMSKKLIETNPDWFLDTMDSLAVDQIALERITVGGNTEYNPAVFPCNEDQDNWYLELLKKYTARKPKYQITTLDNLINKIKNNQVKVDTNCRNCEQNLVTINSDGSLGGCPNVASEHSHATLNDPVETFLGSDGRIEEIVKELTFHDNCLSCDVFDLCGGDCHRLPWQDGRCGGLKNTLRYLANRPSVDKIIFRG